MGMVLLGVNSIRKINGAYMESYVLRKSPGMLSKADNVSFVLKIVTTVKTLPLPEIACMHVMLCLEYSTSQS